MKSIPRLAVLGLVMALSVVLAGRAAPVAALPAATDALKINGAATNATVAVGAFAGVVSTYTDEPNGSNFVLTSSNAAVGTFATFPSSVVPGQNNDGQIVTTAATTVTVTDDADATAETTQVQSFFSCTAAGTTTLSFTQGGAGNATPLTITCGTSSGITFSTTTPAQGVAFTVSVTCASAGQALIASPAGGGAFGITPTNGTYVSGSQVNCLGAGTMSDTYVCTVPGTITFTFIAATGNVTCGGTGTGGLSLSATTGMSGTVSGSCPAAGSVLTQTGPAAFTAATLNGANLTVTAGSIACTGTGTITATFVCNTVGTVSFALGTATATFYCGQGGYNPCGVTYIYNCGNYCGTYTQYTTYNNSCGNYCGTYTTQYATNTCGTCTGYGTQYAYNCNQYPQTTYSTPTSLTITPSASSVACGGTSQVTVRVVGSNGANVADGTAVALAASVGTLSPASISTSGGAATATYTAPAAIPATSVTLRATAGAASNTAGLSVTCTQSQTTTQPSTTAPAPPPVAAPVTIPIIAPPNTGDAGLLALKDGVCED